MTSSLSPPFCNNSVWTLQYDFYYNGQEKHHPSQGVNSDTMVVDYSECDIILKTKCEQKFSDREQSKASLPPIQLYHEAIISPCLNFEKNRWLVSRRADRVGVRRPVTLEVKHQHLLHSLKKRMEWCYVVSHGRACQSVRHNPIQTREAVAHCSSLLQTACIITGTQGSARVGTIT